MNVISESDRIVEEYGYCKSYVFEADDTLNKVISDMILIKNENVIRPEEAAAKDWAKQWQLGVEVIAAGYDTFINAVGAFEADGELIAKLDSRDLFEIQFNQKLLGSYKEQANELFQKSVHYPELQIQGVEPIVMDDQVKIMSGNETVHSTYSGCANGMIMKTSYDNDKFSCNLITAEEAAQKITEESLKTETAPRLATNEKGFSNSEPLPYIPANIQTEEVFETATTKTGFITEADFIIPAMAVMDYANELEMYTREMTYNGEEDPVSARSLLRQEGNSIQVVVVDSFEQGWLDSILIQDKNNHTLASIELDSVCDELLDQIKALGQKAVGQIHEDMRPAYPFISTEKQSYVLDKEHHVEVKFNDEETGRNVTVEYYGSADRQIGRTVNSGGSLDIITMLSEEANYSLELDMSNKDAKLEYITDAPEKHREVSEHEQL